MNTFLNVNLKKKSGSFNLNAALCFPKGISSIFGPSGSGKTTLANLLPQFYLPSSGAIYYDDNEICELNLESLRKNISYVSQDVVLFNDTVRNNIAYGELSDKSDDVISAAAAASCALEFINADRQSVV